MRNKLRTGVTFDLWETLMLDEPEIERQRLELRCENLYSALSKSGVYITVEDVRKAHEQSSAWLAGIWQEHREVPTIEHVKFIVNAASRGTPELTNKQWGELEEAYCSPVLSALPVLNPDAVQTLSVLRERKIPVGLICNTGRSPGKTLRQVLDKFEIAPFFTATIFSDEIGWRKPEQRIFHEAMNQLGASPEHSAHVGDNPEDDIKGAKEAGMRAVLFEREIPRGFDNDPASLYTLSRTSSSSTVEPDLRIRTLTQVLDFVENLAAG